MTIKINNTDIRLRPSAIDNFFGCSYQWGLKYLEGRHTMSNNRAAIGTAIHSAAEVFWTDAIGSNKKDPNLSMMTDAAMEAFEEQGKLGMKYTKDEDAGTSAATIIQGTMAFIDDIIPFAKIPNAVEQFFEVPIEHELVSAIGGTVDYITDNTIADLKTSKRKPTVANYSTQQSIYKFLAESHGIDVKYNQIQSVVLKKVPEGSIMLMEPNVPHAKKLVNHILDTLDLVIKDVAPIETILRGNPGYMFCSDKWCDFHSTCPFSKGEIVAPAPVEKIKL